ncbi:hypothetical protein Bca4012_061707 [Brassica carinata]
MGIDLVMLDRKGSAKQRGFILKKIESLIVSELNSYVLNFPAQDNYRAFRLNTLDLNGRGKELCPFSGHKE